MTDRVPSIRHDDEQGLYPDAASVTGFFCFPPKTMDGSVQRAIERGVGITPGPGQAANLRLQLFPAVRETRLIDTTDDLAAGEWDDGDFINAVGKIRGK